MYVYHLKIRCIDITQSLPMRECGLKQMKSDFNDREEWVTPHAGVWIETIILPLTLFHRRSLPMRECGLKQPKFIYVIASLQSLPMRECGLKLHSSAACCPNTMSLPMRECGLKLNIYQSNKIQLRHSPCGSVD